MNAYIVNPNTNDVVALARDSHHLKNGQAVDYILDGVTYTGKVSRNKKWLSDRYSQITRVDLTEEYARSTENDVKRVDGYKITDTLSIMKEDTNWVEKYEKLKSGNNILLQPIYFEVYKEMTGYSIIPFNQYSESMQPPEYFSSIENLPAIKARICFGWKAYEADEKELGKIYALQNNIQ